MHVQNGSMHEMSVGDKKEMGKCSVWSMLMLTCSFAPYVMEKEGIASSRRIVQFLLIALSPVSLQSTFGSLSLLCFGYETLLPDLLNMENREIPWNLHLLLIQTIKTKFIPLWWRGPAGCPVCSFAFSPCLERARTGQEAGVPLRPTSSLLWRAELFVNPIAPEELWGVAVHSAWRPVQDDPVDDSF